MTTTIKVNTNGKYVAEGKLVTTDKDGTASEVPVSVGPGYPAEASFYVPHGSTAVLELAEREATKEEVDGVKHDIPKT